MYEASIKVSTDVSTPDSLKNKKASNNKDLWRCYYRIKSPIIFVCQQNLYECKEYVAGANAINVFKEMGGLEEEQYNRCEGLSERLIQFYDEH